jgi:hypothetical protein
MESRRMIAGMKISRTGLFLIAAIAIAAIAVVVLSNPLRRSPEKLRLEMLKKTPVGTQLEEVEKIARTMGGHTTISLTAGFHKQESEDDRVVGVKSIRTDVGDYWGIPFIPIRTSVTYFWGFDENGKLIDIWVWKTIDAP